MRIVSGSRTKTHDPVLGSIILKDMLRHSIFLFLLVACVGVSFFIIKQVQITRQNIIELNREKARQDDLEQKFQHLKLQQQVLAEHERVTNIAKKKLQMEPTDIGEEKEIAP